MSPDVSRDRGLAPSLTGLNLQFARGNVAARMLRGAQWSAATSPGGVALRGAPTKSLQRGNARLLGRGICGGRSHSRLACARETLCKLWDVVKIPAEVFHYFVDRFPALLRTLALSRLTWGPSTRHDWRRERFSAPIDFAQYFAAKRRGRASPWLEKVRGRQRSWGTIIDWRTSAIRSCSRDCQS